MVASMGMPGMAGMFGGGGNWLGLAGGGSNPYAGMNPYAGGMAGFGMFGGGMPPGMPPPPNSPWASMVGTGSQTPVPLGAGFQQMPPGAGQPAGPNPNMLAALQAISAQQGQGGAPSTGSGQMPPWAAAQPANRQQAMQAAMMGMPPGAQAMGGNWMGLGNMLAGSQPFDRLRAGSMPRAGRAPVRPTAPARAPRRATYGGGSAGNISLSGY